jgi:hypothetical protein
MTPRSPRRPSAGPAVLTVLIALAAAPATAQDRASVDPTTITGNKELPKVLYIVPWKKPIPGALAARPRTSLLEEALAPIDRQEFRRQLDYRAQLTAPAPIPQTPAPQEKPQ